MFVTLDIDKLLDKMDKSKLQLIKPKKKSVKEMAAPRALLVYETIHKEGLHELGRPTSALAWSGLAAGVSMGFSFLMEGLLLSHVPVVPWRELISKFGYSIGFMIVILGRQQLFTKNTLIPMVPLLLYKSKENFLNVLRLWTAVLLSNLLGTFIFAFLISADGLFGAGIPEALRTSGQTVMEGTFAIKVLKSIFSGWLIALLVWLLPFSGSARVLMIIIITYLIGIGHFNHLIAGSVGTLFLVINGVIPISDYFLDFFAPTFIGNVIGGVSLVAVLNHVFSSSKENLMIAN